MFKGLTRKGRIRIALADIQKTMGSAPIVFAGGLIDEFDEANRTAGLYPGPPPFKRMMLKADSAAYSYFDEMLLVLEGLAFFSHILDRYAFRPSGNYLRDACDLPVSAAAGLVSDLIMTREQALEHESLMTRQHVLEYINDRNIQYGRAKTILGKSSDDDDNVISLASGTIAEKLDPHWQVVIKPVVALILLRCLQDIDWLGLTVALERAIEERGIL